MITLSLWLIILIVFQVSYFEIYLDKIRDLLDGKMKYYVFNTN